MIDIQIRYTKSCRGLRGTIFVGVPHNIVDDSKYLAGLLAGQPISDSWGYIYPEYHKDVPGLTPGFRYRQQYWEYNELGKLIEEVNIGVQKIKKEWDAIVEGASLLSVELPEDFGFSYPPGESKK